MASHTCPFCGAAAGDQVSPVADLTVQVSAGGEYPYSPIWLGNPQSSPGDGAGQHPKITLAAGQVVPGYLWPAAFRARLVARGWLA